MAYCITFNLIDFMDDSMGKHNILVFASHPDDEAFGSAGLIYENVLKKKDVKVVIVTMGEASVEGTQWYYGRKPKTQDFIDIGYVRQKESINAMRVLGLASDDVIFLGYPDNGISTILSSDSYTKDKPYQSEFTDSNKVNYEDSYNMNAPFCKESFFSDIKNIISEKEPDLVFVPHPMDSHPDHKAIGSFVYNTVKNIDKSIKVQGIIIAKSKIPSAKHRSIYKLIGQLKEKYLNEPTKNIKESCLHAYKSQGFLFEEFAFHIEVERFWRLEHSLRAKIIKKVIPSLKY